MSIPVPLEVRLKTDRVDRHVTCDLRDLSFRSTAPGGFASATFSLDRPLSLQPDEIAYYGNVYIQDRRNGNVAWEGRLADPGRGASGDGQVWSLAAEGPSAHMGDRKRPAIFIDHSLEQWRKGFESTRQFDFSQDEVDDGDTPAILFKLPEGSTYTSAAPATKIYAVYRAAWEAGQELARVRARSIDGVTSAASLDQLITKIGTGGRTIVHSVSWSSSEVFLVGSRGGSNAIPSGHNVAEFRTIRDSGSGTATVNTWHQLYDVFVRTILKTAAGADITSGYDDNYVLASDVVKDLLGRVLTEFDGPNATIATTTHQIDHLAYYDGVTAADILEDLATLEPAYYPAAWESNDAGLHRFEYKQWPTSVRYEADVSDGYDSTGSAEGLFNRVSVRWRNPWGFIKTTARTQTVPELDAAGLTREAWIDLGDEVSSLANAQKVGDEFLAEHRYAPNAGTLTIARQIMDYDTGRLVMPWEIRPGYLIRVRGVNPRVDSLNATTRDGVTVFKIAATEFTASSAAAQLELDSYPRTVAQALAKLQKRRTRKR